MLRSFRHEAGISASNIYLFATSRQADGYLSAADVLKTFAYECGASNQSLLKSTNLRKHIATMSQLFSLNDNEMKYLADFLGHDRSVHKNFYRLNESNTQITKLSKFLCIVGDKDVFQYKGGTIEELPYYEDTNEDHVSKESSDGASDIDGISTPQKGAPIKTAQSQPNERRKIYSLRPQPNAAVNLQTPTKKASSSRSSPNKSPLTTAELLNILAVPKRRNTHGRTRWTAKGRKVMQVKQSS